MWKRYHAFLRQPPELRLEWRDRPTGARGWLVINSLRGGAAGGGTRMRPGVDAREVVYLAKAMELKFSVSGPAIGGAKAGSTSIRRTRARPSSSTAGTGRSSPTSATATARPAT